MVHVPAKFRENTSMLLSYSAKTKRDGQTDRQTDRRTDGGRCNISRPEPSAPWEIITETTYSAESGLRNELMGSERKLTPVAPGE